MQREALTGVGTFSTPWLDRNDVVALHHAEMSGVPYANCFDMYSSSMMSKAQAGGQSGVDEKAPIFTNETAGGWCC